MNENNHTPATAFFHAAPHKWNCVQAIFKAYQDYVGLSDEEIEARYRTKGGGRVEGGLCGALYAALEIVGPDTPEGRQLKADFEQRLKAYTCAALKTELKVPCLVTVQTADELLFPYVAQFIKEGRPPKV